MATKSKFAPGTPVAYTAASLPKMGTMTGTIVDDEYSGVVFMPDEVYHDRLYQLYGYEPEAGLFIEGKGVTVTAA